MGVEESRVVVERVDGLGETFSGVVVLGVLYANGSAEVVDELARRLADRLREYAPKLVAVQGPAKSYSCAAGNLDVAAESPAGLTKSFPCAAGNLAGAVRIGAGLSARSVLGGGSGCCPTVAEAFARYYECKYGEGAARRLSRSAGERALSSFRKLAPIAERRLDSLTVDELQALVNSVRLKRSSVEKLLSTIRGIYDYAVSRELCCRNPSRYLCMPDVPESVHHQDFTDEELAVLWAHREDRMVRMVLIMCYSGFRYSAWAMMETRLDEGFFRGGVKTAAGRGRVVPIHSAIMPLVEQTLREGGYMCGLNQYGFIRRMARKMEELGIDIGNRHHTPHSCRHTFSRLCESYGVREPDRKRMMGHSFKGDITNGVYGHRTLEELRAEIEKIQLPALSPDSCG